MTIELFHTSSNPIKKIEEFYGVFDDVLFFAEKPYSMSSRKRMHIYTMEVDEDQIIGAYKLFDAEIINEVSEMYDCDTDTAERLLDARLSPYDLEYKYGQEPDIEKDWSLQALRGKCAKKMGYIGCEDTDEQGAVWIIPMLGREPDLTLKRIDEDF